MQQTTNNKPEVYFGKIFGEIFSLNVERGNQ